LRFYEGVGHLRDWLTNDQIDLAILPDSELASARNLNLLRLVDELVYLVGAPNEFTLGTFCSPDAVIDRQLILTPPPSTLRGNLDVIVQKLGRELNVIIETESLQVQKSLVRAGLGNALLPHSAIWRASQEGSISVCVVEGWSLARVLAWKANQPMTPAVQRMIEVTNAQVEALAREGAFGRNQIDAQFGSCQAPAAAPVFKT
jgi:DNA-binding transcriptional LysR family regulator